MPSVSPLFVQGEMRYADGVQGQGCLSACCDVARGKHDFTHGFTCGCSPATIEMVFEQQSIGQIHHAKVVKCVGWTPFNRVHRGPLVPRAQQVSLVGAGDITLIYGDQNHRIFDHALTFAHLYFEMPQTRLDIDVTPPSGMNEDLPPSIPFLPDTVVHHGGGAVVSGMDGEFQWLDVDMRPLGAVSLPHPMRLRQAVIVNDHLIGTWLDRELMLACMGAIPLGSQQDGKPRSELRTSIGTRITHYPAGNTWAHALDAEPMALATDGNVVVFELYRRGLYGIGLNAEEHWRMPSPEWSYPKRRPRNEETIALHVHNNECWVTSRGGRVQRRTLDTGQLLEEHLFEGVEAPLEHHFKHGEHDLLCTTDGMVTWLANMAVVQQAQLSGPVQDATWDEQLNGWRVAGWREEVVVSPTILDRRATDELPVHIVPTGDGALVLYNDGSWEQSSFAPSGEDE